MQITAYLVAALTLLTPPALAQRTLAPADMEADLFQLSDHLMSLHAGLQRYSSAAEMDEAFGMALFAVAEEQSELEFFRIVARLVAQVHCGHTRAIPTQSIQLAALEQRGLLPVEVLLEGERLFVVRSLDDSLPVGAELTAIDGRSIADIRRTVFSMSSGDGFIETGKQRALERRFARLYALLVQGADEREPFAVRLAGEAADVLVDGMPPRAFEGASTSLPTRPRIALELRTQDDLAVLSVSSFGDPESGKSFPEQLGEAFARLRDSGIGHLALDLRGNGGGDDMYGALLVSYFSPERFRYFDHITVTADYEGAGGIEDRDGLRLVTEHPGTQVQQPSQPGFRGEAFVLIDGRTFSTAADVATVLHHNRLATFVGEETGGGYDGNTSGRTERHDLVHSRIAFSCPLWCYTTANLGHEQVGRGVPVDHPVVRTIGDVLGERDPDLQAVLDLIAAQ